MFASALPGSSLCLLVCLRVLLAGVLLGFSDFGCSSGWVVAVSFPGLVSVSGLSALVPVVQVCLRAAHVFCLVAGSLSAGFVWGSGFPVLLFILLGPDLTLSLSAFLAPASRPWGFTGWGLCLFWLLSWLGLSLAISWWPTYWYPCVSFRFSSGRSFPPSWWGPAGLLRWTSFQSVLLVYPGIRCSSWLSPLHSARFWFIVFSVPCGWVGALLPSLRPAPGLSLFGLLAVPPFLLSRFLAVCFPGLWVSLFPGSFLVLGSSFPVLVFYSFLLRGTRGGIWILPSAPLGCFILLSRLVSCFCFLRRLFRLFSWFQGFLSYFSDLVFCSSQSSLGLQWFWSSCPFRCWGSRLPLPIAVFRISSRGLVPFCSRILYLDSSSSVFLGGIQPSPPVSLLSLGWPPRAISILRLSLFALFLEALLFMFSSFSPLVLLGWLFILSPSPWSTRCFCWSVPTLPSCAVGPPGSPHLALPLRSGVLLPGCTCSVSSVCIDSASFLSCSSGVLRPGGCFPGWSPPLWLFSFTRPTFVHCGLVLCCLSPVCLPHLGRGYVVSSVFVSYAVCLCRLCSWCLRDGVTLAWVECRCCFLPSIGTKATFLSVLSIPSGWGHPLGQVCFLFPLISIEGSLSFWFLFLPLGSRVRCLFLPLVPWVGFIVGLCAPLLCVALL